MIRVNDCDLNSIGTIVNEAINIREDEEVAEIDKSSAADNSNNFGLIHQDSTSSFDIIATTSNHYYNYYYLSNDVIQEILSFLTYQDLLLNVSLVNKRWCKLSLSDHLWRLHLEQERYRLPAYTIRKRRLIHGSVVDDLSSSVQQYSSAGNLKAEFLNLLRMGADDKNIKRKINNVMATKRVFQRSYGLVLPLLFFIGLTLCSFLIPFQQESEVAPDSTKTFFNWSISCWAPFLFLSLPSYLLILVSVLLDPFLLNPIKNKYYHVLGTQLHSQGDSEAVKSMNLLVWSLSWVPTSLLCIFLKSQFWPMVTYSLALSPIFAMCAILLLVPPIVWYNMYRKGRLDFHENTKVFIVYCLCAVVGLFFVIQFGLISGKLDGTIASTWGGIFTPIWLLFTVIILSCPLTCFLTVKSNSDFFAGLSFASCIICSVILPLMIFMVLLSLKLDNSIHIQWIYLFIPLYLFEGMVILLLSTFGISAVGDGLLPSI